MLELLFYIIGSGILLFLGYLVSVYTNAIYIDPDEVKEIFPEISDRKRQRLEKFISNPRVFFQIGRLIRVSVSILLGAVAILTVLDLEQLNLMPSFGLYVIIIPLFWILTATFFIYLPRRITIEQAHSKLIRFLPLMNLIYILFSPAIRVLSRISPSDQPEDITEEQKDDIVERAIETLAESAGISSPIIEEDEKEMIHQIFQLDVTEAEEIMIPRVYITGIEINATLGEIQKTVGEFGYSRYPVYKESIDNIIGVLYVKDLLLLNESARKNFTLKDHIRQPLVIGEHRKIDELLAEFRKAKTHLAIVIDEFGGVSGLVTLEDILEEIVGEIEDEHDPEHVRDIVRLDNGNLEVSGTCPLEDLADELEIELQQKDFETVGGMIYDEVGSVPSEGASLHWKNCKLTVTQLDGQRIVRVLVIPSHSTGQ
ncbi:MAG: hemolysin family protein [candidate division Zixibacteria bacterium]